MPESIAVIVIIAMLLGAGWIIYALSLKILFEMVEKCRRRY